jgi:hypothetical protein
MKGSTLNSVGPNQPAALRKWIRNIAVKGTHLPCNEDVTRIFTRRLESLAAPL